MCACESIRKDIIMVDGVNETTSSQNSIYNLSLSDLSTSNLDDKTEKAIRKFFKKQGLNEGDTLDLSTYDKDNNGIIDDDERKEAGLSKKVVNAFNKVFQRKTEQIAKAKKRMEEAEKAKQERIAALKEKKDEIEAVLADRRMSEMYRNTSECPSNYKIPHGYDFYSDDRLREELKRLNAEIKEISSGNQRGYF